jgi:hypothetical protein
MKDTLMVLFTLLFGLVLITGIAYLVRTKPCNQEQTRKSWLLADSCVAAGGDKCWDKVQEHMRCKAL